MTLFHSGFWWVWGPVIVICLIGMLTTGKKSPWYISFWVPLMALCLVFLSVFLQSCGAGPRDGPSGLVKLFVVFPAVAFSGLGIVGLFAMFLARPRGDAWTSKFAFIGAGIGCTIAALSVWGSIEKETETLSIIVLDGEGRPCAGVPVEVVMSDLVTNKHNFSEVTDETGRVIFQVWPFRYLEVFCSRGGEMESRSIFGDSGYGGVRCWKHMWGSRRQYYFGLSCSFLDDTSSSFTTLYLRSEDKKPLSVAAERLLRDVAKAATHPEGGRFLSSIRCPEGLGMLEEIAKVWREDPAMEDAVSTCLRGLAELVGRIWQESRGRADAAQFGRIAGDSPEVHAERLIRTAKPMLGLESSSAGVYGELRQLALTRVQDLVQAHPTATERGKQMIRSALEDIQPPYGEVAQLLPKMDLEGALRLLARINRFASHEEFEQARSWVEQAKRNHGNPQSERFWFEHLGHRFARPQDYGIKFGP